MAELDKATLQRQLNRLESELEISVSEIVTLKATISSQSTSSITLEAEKRALRLNLEVFILLDMKYSPSQTIMDVPLSH